jgi:glycosyltransferase involved in cell wall biosynthesis
MEYPMTPKIALLAARSGSGEIGGAERFFAGLNDAFHRAGYSAELVHVYNNESNFEHIEETYLRYYDLDLSRFDGIISTKAPSFVVRHPNHICYLMHTMRVFYDMFDFSFPVRTDTLVEQRRLIQALDTAALQFPRTRQIFTIGDEVASRLSQFNGLTAKTVRHPTTLQGLRCGAFKYLFIPGRLHKWKRVDLAIRAMRLVNSPVELIVSGIGEDADRLMTMARDNPHIRFVGRVTDEELADLYADALAVLFLPQREDLGLVTMEGFLSGKPVITCTDSGEPARLVKDGQSGFVSLPEPASIAACIDRLALHPERAAEMGENGRTSIASITWENVVQALAAGLGFDTNSSVRAVSP